MEGKKSFSFVAPISRSFFLKNQLIVDQKIPPFLPPPSFRFRPAAHEKTPPFLQTSELPPEFYTPDKTNPYYRS